MRVALTPQAVEDLKRSRDHYVAIDPQLGARFLEGVDAAIERIVMFPDGAPPVEGFDGMRRARLRQFPYGVFYQRAGSGALLIVRVLHTRRQQGDALGGPDPALPG